jgi:hypothetical protein
MKNKAALGAIAALIVVAYGGGTWFAGTKIKSTYDRAFDELPKRYSLVRVIERNYDRSFTGAVSTVTLEIGCTAENAAMSPPAKPIEPADPDDEEDEDDKDGAAATPPKPVRFTIRDTIHHGPIAGGTLAVAVIDSELLLDPKIESDVKKIFGTAQPVTARTRVGFGGAYASDITVAPAKMAEAGKSELTWQGATAHIAMDGARTSLQYDLTLPGLDFNHTAKGVHAKMGRLTLKVDAHRVEDWMLATGTSEGRIDGLEFEVLANGGAKPAKPLPKIVLQNIDMHGEAGVKEGLYDSSVTFKSQGSIGATKLDRLEFTSGARRIQAAGYRKLADAWLQSNAAAGCGKGSAKASRAALDALMDRLAPDLKAMAKFNPEAGIDRMVVEMGGQRGELSYSAGFAGVTDEDLKLPGLELMMARGVLKADARLPVKWIEQLAEAGAENGQTPPTRHCSRPCSKMSFGSSMPMKTILLCAGSPSAHCGPRSLPISWCTPWKITLRSVPFMFSTPL